MRAFSYAVIAAIGFATTAHAENPLFSYQGRLLGSGGQPVNESVTMAVNIYTSATANASVYSEQVGSIPVQNGIYSFSYGTNIPALRLALGSEESWLELVVNGSALSPRQRLHYTPYAVSLDENSLVQSTQFLLDMIAKHELEIQALRAQAGLMNTSGGRQYFTETFPDANGQNNLVDTNLTDAAYMPDGVYRPGSVLTSPAQLVSSNCYEGNYLEMNVVSQTVNAVRAEVSRAGSNTVEGFVNIGWRYVGGDTVSNSVPVICSNSTWQTVTVTNSRPWSNVVFVSVKPLKATNDCWSEERLVVTNVTVFLGFSMFDYSRVVMNIPPLTGRLSHAALYANVAQNTNPDLIQFNLTDGNTTISNINLGRKYSLASLSNNPTKLYILLKPSPTNSLQDPAIESVMFKWWH